MSNELTIHHAISKRAKEQLAKAKSDIQPGDVIINVDSGGYREGWVYKVLKMASRHVVVAVWDKNGWDEHWDDTPDRPITLDYAELHRHVKYDGDPATLEADVLTAAKNPEATLGTGTDFMPTDETALAPSQGKEPMLAAERALQTAMNKAMIARAIMEKKRDEISSIVHRFKEGLKKVRKVLHVAELYLGIDEEILQIRDGDPAPADEPICIRQMILYMDEELGDPEDGGMDWKRIEDFDAWTAQGENAHRVLPEKKGVVALQVRRKMKNYGSLWANVRGDVENSRTYLLIRNGQRLYRIWMNEHIHPRLFPRRDEFKSDPGQEPWGYELRRQEETEFAYKKYGVMLQGLIQRTDVFRPMAREIDLFRPETCEGLVRFIRDDELLLPTGRLPWREWQKQINAQIKVGSRVVWRGRAYYSEDKIRERTNYAAAPGTSWPARGIYTAMPGLYQKFHEELRFRFIYNPGDTPWRRYHWKNGYDDSPRKRGIGFHFYLSEVLNYDQIDLADIEFYLHCRTERQHYLDMMPLLYELRKQRQAEIEHEKGLVVLLAHELKVPEQTVWKAVEWWKNKCRWKRSVSDQDGLALRMIRRKIKKETP